MATNYDVVVIGAGSGGLTAAVGLTKVGKKVLLVEREHIGGECTNAGCVPSKALLHHAKAYYQATTIAGQNTQTNNYRQDAFNYVREKIADFLKDETATTFEKIGITVIIGEAEFTAQNQLKVNNQTYTYKTAIIATGSSPRLTKIAGLDDNLILTNQNIFKLETIPNRTLIIGAGPVGLELGQALALLGSKVTITAIDNEFARLEDPAIRPILRSHFEALNIKIELNAFIQKVENGEAIFNRQTDDTITATFSVPFDKVLLAIGRIPNLPKGLALAEVKADKFGIQVNNQYQTSNQHIYALGDVAQRLKFTHTADDTARQIVTHIISYGLLRVNKQKAVPKVTYTLPEVAQVGLSWAEAITKFGEDKLMRIEVPFTQNDRAKTESATTGVLVVIARRLSGAVLGAHIIGPTAGEIIALFTLAIDQRLSLWKLRSLIYAYPTYSLIIKKAGDQFLAQQIADLKTDLFRTIKHPNPKLIILILSLGLILFAIILAV